jgi:hypothetical protein
MSGEPVFNIGKIYISIERSWPGLLVYDCLHVGAGHASCAIRDVLQGGRSR